MLYVNLGGVIPGVRIAIVDDRNVILPSGTIGRLQVKGEVVSPGYYKNPEANREAFLEDGWFDTGDLGFLCQGQLAIVGRSKATIIINGANYYSHEIEAVVESMPGVEISYTAACPVSDRDRELLAIFFNSSVERESELRELIHRIGQQVTDKIGVSPDYLIPVAKEAIPKTAIGKIQRQQLSQRFQAGEFDVHRYFTPKGDRAMSSEELQLQISQIWQEVLHLEGVGSSDNFFELGGNSLLLLQVQKLCIERLGRQVNIVDLFRYPTVEALGKYLSQDLRKRPARPPQIKGDRQSRDIAVIGMACRFPGADNIHEFWQNLCQGVESIARFADSEIIGVDPKLLQDPNYVKARPILSDVESFDAEFFGYSPKEAALMDPQQRLFLECAWESLEDAGCNPLSYPGKIGIYGGAGMNTYLANNIYPQQLYSSRGDRLQVATLDSPDGFQLMVANDKDYLTTRVSYKLHLTGPSVNVQTACSTSLAAIHMASQSLAYGECSLVLAGGVSVQVPQKIGYLYREGTIVSPDGHCRAFDRRAGGTIFGNGVGIVVLKRLEEALADGDRIYGIIKGSAIDNDGGAKVGYLAPNGEGQARVTAAAMAIAGVEPETISYVEAHGTGTMLGDPIEIAGLTSAFSSSRQNFCALGTVKSNIGHLQIASGVAGFIKTVLALYHRQIPASLHFEKPNPQIDFANSPFYVNTTLKPWQTSSGLPRRAGVNSLGIGGTNVHLILEEAPATAPVTNEIERPLHLLTLSASLQKIGSPLASPQQEGEQLTSSLQKIGSPLASPQQQSPAEFQIDPSNESDFQRLLASQPLHGVVHLWSLDTPMLETETDLEAAVQMGCRSTLYLIQALAKLENSPRLWLVTRGAVPERSRRAQPVGTESPDETGLRKSCLWGMGKVIALEHPEFNCTRIDLDPRSPDNEVQALFAEIWSEDVEDQVAFRDGKRQVARLVRKHLQSANKQQLRLEISPRGILDNLKWQATTRRSPGPSEVEIQVRATGLNFRDVLNALDLYPGEPGPLGLECTGRIVALGPGIENLQVGDVVVAIAPGSFSEYIRVPANLVMPLPKNLNCEQAATIPGAFLTAYYSLQHLGKMTSSDRVLIHAAAGGVGQAAIQLAQQVGAEIFATAAPEKWEFLKSLGVKYIMNSRTLDFAPEVMSLTRGQGADIVLNSLAGEFRTESLLVLHDRGRFLEIGKQGIFSPRQVAQLKPDADYFIVDLVRAIAQEPAQLRTMLSQLMSQFQTGQLKPLPYKLFLRDRVIEAFRYMQQGKHIGKIVISGPQEFPTLRADGTYLSSQTKLITHLLGAGPQETLAMLEQLPQAHAINFVLLLNHWRHGRSGFANGPVAGAAGGKAFSISWTDP